MFKITYVSDIMEKNIGEKNNKYINIVNITILFVKDRNMQPHFYDFHYYETYFIDVISTSPYIS